MRSPLLPWLDTLLWIVGLMYVGGPILIWLTLRLRAYARYEPVEFTTLPPHVQGEIHELSAAFIEQVEDVEEDRRPLAEVDPLQELK